MRQIHGADRATRFRRLGKFSHGELQPGVFDATSVRAAAYGVSRMVRFTPWRPVDAVDDDEVVRGMHQLMNG